MIYFFYFHKPEKAAKKGEKVKKLQIWKARLSTLRNKYFWTNKKSEKAPKSHNNAKSCTICEPNWLHGCQWPPIILPFSQLT